MGTCWCGELHAAEHVLRAENVKLKKALARLEAVRRIAVMIVDERLLPPGTHDELAAALADGSNDEDERSQSDYEAFGG
jgi:hypothetical protein